ncbi:pyridoxal-phosphate dependent enzyme [Photorhabdus tasmaniensis]|uniref:Tryptophan synthase beta chain-like PALP domain-containing protein n=1 Tax=Photorhabdus tasmaniensis TaxID=1004159 RepID=A0ABX0GLR1_9GAMM|nr:pyridoxal-phosphate dependent enzyme [Photorhabdus tasmaniensis]NHB89168.1 hypothetical protein [Photorhabdus tasmaniensis]
MSEIANKVKLETKMFLGEHYIEPIDIGFFPTPLIVENRISKEIGRKILIKREDMVDVLGCGHKLRRMRYLLSGINYNEIDALVTIGSVPSNQAKTVALFARILELESHIIIGGDKQTKPSTLSGNYLVTKLMADFVQWYEFTSWIKMKEIAQKYSEQLSKQGILNFFIDSGASQESGLIGSIELGIEIKNQLDIEKESINHIVICAGSGASAVGLAIASELQQASWTIHGICIGEGSETVLTHSIDLMNTWNKKLGTEFNLEKVKFYDHAIGLGYDEPTDYEIEISEYILKQYGMLFDLNYMVKTFIGMKILLEQEIIPKGETIVLVNSGGNIGFFDSHSKKISNKRTEYGGAL